MSVNIVNKTTGDITPVAGVSTDKVGNLNALSTTDKSSCVGAINELFHRGGREIGNLSNLTTTDKSNIVSAINEINGFFVNLGPITANNWTDFFKNACAAFHALNPKTYIAHNVFLSWGGTRYCGQLIDYGDAVDFTITGGGGATLYCGYSMLVGAGETKFHTYSEDAATYGAVSIDSTYYVSGCDWLFSRLGNMRILYTTDLKDIPTGTTVVGYIPEGDRPALDFYHYIYSYNKQTTFMLHFTLNGAITINNETGQAINDDIWLNDNVVYNV